MADVEDSVWYKDVTRAEVTLRSGLVERIAFYRDLEGKTSPKLLLERRSRDGKTVRFERREGTHTVYANGSIRDAFGESTTDLMGNCQTLFSLALTTWDGVLDFLGRYDFEVAINGCAPSDQEERL